jgi:hypothetical protein
MNSKKWKALVMTRVEVMDGSDGRWQQYIQLVRTTRQDKSKGVQAI